MEKAVPMSRDRPVLLLPPSPCLLTEDTTTCLTQRRGDAKGLLHNLCATAGLSSRVTRSEQKARPRQVGAVAPLLSCSLRLCGFA